MISFNNQTIAFTLKNKLKLKQWIKLITEKEKHSVGTINYVFCNDEELLEINLKHLIILHQVQKQEYTQLKNLLNY